MSFMGIGASELLLILLIVLILFGAKRVPELAKGLGSGIREFKKAAKEAAGAGGDAKEAAAIDTAVTGQRAPSTHQSDGARPSDAERS